MERLAASDAIKVMIVDDHPVVREGLRACIERQPDMRVCGEAGDIATAARVAEETRPDLMLIDVSLKGQNGLDLVRIVRHQRSDVKILVVSMYDESLYAERAVRAGANGFINKQELAADLITASRRVLAGEIYLSSEMTRQLLNRSLGVAHNKQEDSQVALLSDRELEVFELIGRGMSLRAIADRLHRSLHTVQTHRENIRQKMHLPNSAEVSRRAFEWMLERK